MLGLWRSSHQGKILCTRDLLGKIPVRDKQGGNRSRQKELSDLETGLISVNKEGGRKLSDRGAILRKFRPGL